MPNLHNNTAGHKYSSDGEGVTDDFQPNPSCSELIQVGCNSNFR
jgi:hypothetical protein